MAAKLGGEYVYFGINFYSLYRGAGTGPADPAVAGPIFLKRSVNYVGVSITDKIRPN